MNYKKYIIFAYYDDSPSGGLSDIYKDVDTIEEAKELIKSLWQDSIEIVDRDTWEIVYSKTERQIHDL
jgi:hypothetical protein